jgi:superfamily I DNA/RNA helicase
MCVISGWTKTKDADSQLVRFNALSRALEQALQREGIPVRLLGGHKFFERMEV